MTALTIKLLREILHLRGQLIAIVIVIAGGIANFVAFRSVHASLSLTQQAYYADSRFADVFLTARRAPESLRERIAAVDGVAAVDTRVVTDVLLDIPGMDEAASGTILSVPDHGQPLLNRLHLRSGAWIREGSADEVIISVAFADANGFKVGDQFSAVINGRKRRLTIVGTALSPEYTIEMSPGTMILDNKRYGVMWMSRSALAAMYDMKGAFNSATLRLEGGANVRRVMDEVDIILKPYGSIGAIPRSEQMAHRFLSDEIAQVQGTATVVPTIFLGVAIFLLNISLLRLVATQRMSIAILKAFGYSNAAIGMHYVGFAMVATAVGSILGYGLGLWLGGGLTELYGRFYRFPVLRFDVPDGVILGAMVISAIAAVAGAWGAVRTVSKLPPAESMRPAAPSTYRPGIIERLGVLRRLDPVMRMIWRTIERRPLRSALTVLMVSLAVTILVVGRWMFDLFDVIMDQQFNAAFRQDAMVTFVTQRSSDALYDVERLPGVLRVEPFRAVPVDISKGPRTKRLAITSIGADQELVRVIGEDGLPVPIPKDGIVLTTYLAESFGYRIGDTISVQLLEGDRRSLRIPLSGTADELFGVQAYMDRSALYDLLREQGSLSGAYVMLDADKADAFSKAVKETPMVAGVMLRATTIKSFDENYKENMDISTIWIFSFAMIIAFGVVYNSARISLSERANELASLRILGFTIGEITLVLLGEQLILTMMAVPVGFILGSLTVFALPAAFTTDLFRFPVILTSANYGMTALTISVVATVTGLLLYRKLNKLDLIAVLKSRE
jgi:putative ABC transport system permease protein